jgi:hypothetical protein
MTRRATKTKLPMLEHVWCRECSTAPIADDDGLCRSCAAKEALADIRQNMADAARTQKAGNDG